MKVPTVAIVGSESLLGREILQLFRDRRLPYNVRHVGSEEEEAGKLTDERDEDVVITSLDESNLETSDAVILAGNSISSHKAWDLLAGHREAKVIDMSRTLEDIPTARLCAPTLGIGASGGNPAVIAHPAAISMAYLFSRLSDLRIRHSVIHIFEPASELGQRGINELHQQTIKLFAFQSLPTDVYDKQLAFNMLPRLGADAPLQLEQIEQNIERHLVSLLAGGRTPMPSMRLIQAPVFHGYGFSVWIQFDSNTSTRNLAVSLMAEDEPPTNVGVAGEKGISIGDIRSDPNQSKAYWIWMAMDNLRFTAENAVQLLEQECRV